MVELGDETGITQWSELGLRLRLVLPAKVMSGWATGCKDPFTLSDSDSESKNFL